MTADIPQAGPRPDENMISLEDLDKFIEEEDPNFIQSMVELKVEVASLQLDIKSENIDRDIDLARTTEMVGKKIKEKTRFEIFRRDFISALRRFLISIKNLLFSTKSRFMLLGEKIKHFARFTLPDLLRFFKFRSVHYSQLTLRFTKTNIDAYQNLSKVRKFSLFFTLISTLAALFFLGKTFSQQWLPHFTDPLIHSLEDKAISVGAYKNKNELQDLFQAFPEVEFYVLLSKVIVNLKRDENSSQNPMGIFEIYLGIDSKDTAIEVKDREHEILDTIQRSLEPFTYTEAVSMSGKTRMKSVMRDNVNNILNQGKVFHVYFNTFITNP